MTTTRMRTTTIGLGCSLAVAVLSPACSCGDNVILYDVFQPIDKPTADALNTYASHAQVPLHVRAASPFGNIDDIPDPKASGSVSIDPDTDIERKDGVLTFAVLTGDAGAGTIDFGDAGAPRDVTVKDADAIALAVTAPVTPGVELPDVDTSNVRIYAGGKAAFRTTLHSGSDEIVGLKAVTASTATQGYTMRNGTGCASDTCSAARNAVEISLADGVTDAADVAVAAGNANTTVHVVPTADADIDDVVMDAADLKDGKGSVVAHVVAGTEPVFGAKVTWTVDGTAFDSDGDGTPDVGDVFQFDAPAPSSDVHPAAADVVATIAGKDASTSVTGTNFSVTSMTGACGAAPASTASLAALLVGLGMWRRRRR